MITQFKDITKDLEGKYRCILIKGKPQILSTIIGVDIHQRFALICLDRLQPIEIRETDEFRIMTTKEFTSQDIDAYWNKTFKSDEYRHHCETVENLFYEAM